MDTLSNDLVVICLALFFWILRTQKNYKYVVLCVVTTMFDGDEKGQNLKTKYGQNWENFDNIGQKWNGQYLKFVLCFWTNNLPYQFENYMENYIDFPQGFKKCHRSLVSTYFI